MSISITALSAVLIASLPQSGLEESLSYHKYPNTDLNQNAPSCYPQTNNKDFDLTRLCGFVPTSSLSGGGYSGGGGYSSNSGGGSGVCNTPNDRASNGNRCGDRAASERKGGR